MIARGLDVGMRLSGVVVGVGVGFALADDRAREAETTLLMGIVGPFGGASSFVRLSGAHILVVSRRSTPFVATVTPSCSALGAVLAFLAVAALLLRGPLHRRAIGFALAAGLCIVANLLRIAIALVIGARVGRHDMVTFHDWFGTVIGMTALFGGFVMLLGAMLPSLKSLVDADASTGTIGITSQSATAGREQHRP